MSEGTMRISSFPALNWSLLLAPILNRLLTASFRRVAKEYALDLDEVRAAWAYYAHNREEVETKLKRNENAST